MQNRIFPAGEEYPFGGPGRFILSTIQAAEEELRRDYTEKIDLIYIDPPFGTGDGFSVKLPGIREKVKIPAYSDNLDTASYLAMMRTVLTLCHDLLKDTGSIYVHIDYRMSARIRLMLDDIFGESCFQNEIIWAYKSGGRSIRHYSRKHDNILFYRKSAKAYFDISSVGVPRGPMKRNNMKRTVDENGKLCFSIRSGGKTYTYYEDTPVYPSDVWADIEHMHQRDPERTGYATQKPEALLRRIISASCPEGGLVADFFGGSGTTAAVAAKLNRRYITVDASPASLGIIRKRLLSAGRDASLIKQSSALRLSYPVLPEGDFEAEFSFSRDAFGTYVRLDSAESKFGLSFMAFGTTDSDGIFRPAEYTLFPAPGSRLSDSSCRANTVQLCDNAGGMRFYEV
jgi:DNA modification methylase